ncbi:hypothetical protein [Eel River basin pequenovirus]|uniref:hypothetical protein n=1 Tax=Eel River basin pequenovirus TaxID=1609634 RepID=UPI0005B25081|nr:hypothetical protein [Eel River basin pequenovirus]AJK28218.1 hypothetical protein [Eel River basin pequenovirus]
MKIHEIAKKTYDKLKTTNDPATFEELDAITKINMISATQSALDSGYVFIEGSKVKLHSEKGVE